MNNLDDKKPQVFRSICTSHVGQIQNRQKNIRPYLFEKIQNKFLNENSEILNKFIKLNRIKEETELHEFMINEQRIMNSQLVNEKITELTLNINKLKDVKQEKGHKIQQMNNKIQLQVQILQNLKFKVISGYEKKRRQQQKEQTIYKSIDRLNQLQKNFKKSFGQQICHTNHIQKLFGKRLTSEGQKRENENKQNCSKRANINIKQNKKQKDEFKQEFLNQQILRLVSFRANKQIIQIRVRQLTQKVKERVRALKQKESQRKRITKNMGDIIKKRQAQNKYYQIPQANHNDNSSIVQASPN